MQVQAHHPAAAPELPARAVTSSARNQEPAPASPSQARQDTGHGHDRDADTVNLSPRALAAANKPGEASDNPNSNAPADPDTPDTSNTSDAQAGPDDAPAASERKANGEPLTEEEQTQVKEMRDRDREVRTHEQAHKNAAGPYAKGGPSFEYQQGPDGRRYAVGGHVNIDTSEVSGDPQATIQKMQVVRRAALAPGEPSEQDRKVAAEATQTEQKARAQLREESAPAQRESQEPSKAIGSLLDLTA